MKGSKAIVGVFSYLDDTIKAVDAAKEAGYEFQVYSPVPNHYLEHATTEGRSPLKYVTGAAALTGLTFGFALAILCSLDYPLRVSAKDIVSVPGFFVIGYECTILFGAIFTLKALFLFCGIPDVFRKVGYDPRFSDDKFGVVIGCNPSDIDAVSGVLKSAGAEEVDVKDGL